MIKIEDLYVLVLDQRLNVYNTMWCMCVKMLACGLLSSTSACTITIKDCYSILNQGFITCKLPKDCYALCKALIC